MRGTTAQLKDKTTALTTENQTSSTENQRSVIPQPHRLIDRWSLSKNNRQRRYRPNEKCKKEQQQQQQQNKNSNQVDQLRTNPFFLGCKGTRAEGEDDVTDTPASRSDMTELPVHTLHWEEIHSHSVTPEIQYSHKSTHSVMRAQVVTTETPRPQRGTLKNMTQGDLTDSFVKSIKYYQKYKTFQLQWQQSTANTTQQHRVRTIIKRQVLLNILYLELHLAPILPFVTELLMNSVLRCYLNDCRLLKTRLKGRQLQPHCQSASFFCRKMKTTNGHDRP